MSYIKSLIINFLTVFFADHILPGMHIDYYSRLPRIEGDVIFAAALGFLSSLIFPILRIFHLRPSHIKIGLITFALSFFAYSIVNLLPVGVKVESASGYLLCSLVVWLVSYLTNHLEFRQYIKKQEEKEKKLHEALHKEETEHEKK